MRNAIAVIVLLSLTCLAASAKPPNFVIIIADDLGYSDIGAYGGEIETPNLDRLASEGIRFTSFYNTGRCWPTRSAILTGYYPQQIRMDPPKPPVPKWTRVLPHYFKPLGYRAYHSGKWHLNGAPLPIKDGGFDRSYLSTDHNRFFSPKTSKLDDKPLPPVEESSGYYATTAIAQYGIDFLQEHAANHAGKPFLLYLAYISPHFPLHAIQEDIDKYRDRYLEGWDAVRERRLRRLRSSGIIQGGLPALEPDTVPHWNLSAEELRERIGPGEAAQAIPWNELTGEQRRFQATKMAIHAAMVDRVDQETGRVLQQLREMGVYDDTVIFFLSDNGASAEQIIRGDNHDKAAPPGSSQSYLCLGPGWSTAANTPFRRHKHWVHEGGISTPMIVKWVNGIPARGELRNTIGHVVDFLPTMLDLAGADPGATWNGEKVPALPGRSLAPAFAKDVAIERPYLFFSHQGNQALRVGKWKLVSAKSDGNVPELYDMSTDRSESEDLAKKDPERVRRMERQWEEIASTFEAQAGPQPEPEP